MVSTEVDDDVIAAASGGDLAKLQALGCDRIRAGADKHRSNALHFCAGFGHGPCVEWLLKAVGFHVDVRNKQKRTALHWAARNGRAEICELLVKTYGSSVDAEAEARVTPVQLAVWQGHEGVVQLLASFGANLHVINTFQCGLVHWVALCPHFGKKNKQMKKGAVGDRSSAGGDRDSPFCGPFSEEDGDKDTQAEISMKRLCRFLHGQGLDFTMVNKQGHTPLHKAGYSGNYPCAAFLVCELGMEDSLTDNHGNYGADQAARMHHPKLAAWLRAKASPRLRIAMETLQLGSAASEVEGLSFGALREAFVSAARRSHPNGVAAARANETVAECLALEKAIKECGTSTNGESFGKQGIVQENVPIWNDVQEAYEVLRGALMRTEATEEESNNLAHQQLPALTYDKFNDTTVNLIAPENVNENDTMSLFRWRLSILLHNEFRTEGLSLSQLPRQLQKIWNVPAPNPRDFGCRRLVELLRRIPDVVKLEVSEKTNQIMLYAPIPKDTAADSG